MSPVIRRNYPGLLRHLASTHELALNVLRAFFQGFNSSGFPFAAIDCGSHKQAADDRLTGETLSPSQSSLQHTEHNFMLDWLSFYINQPSCRYVFLGGAHDSGYASTLNRFPPHLRDKIKLLRTSPNVAAKQSAMGLPEVWFPGLFYGHRERVESAKVVRQYVSKTGWFCCCCLDYHNDMFDTL